MSHFSVLVIGDNPEQQLEKYDENLELPMHQVASREQLIQNKRQWIEDYKNGLYAEFLKDKEAYKKGCTNERHIDYIENIFPKMLDWSDDECYEDEIKDYKEYIEDGAEWCEIHEDGSLWETSNGNAKWDWYQMGGCYRGLLKLKDASQDKPLYDGWQWSHRPAGEYDRLKKEGFCDQALAGEIENLDKLVVFAVVKDGEWYEKGKMGWWDIVTDAKEKEVWEEEVHKLCEKLPSETLLTIMDCHI
jgi:hypothetical protein